MSLDNLGIFTTCTNAQLGPLLTSLKNADVSAGNVVVTAPETNTCEALMPQLSAIGPVRWTHQPTDGEHSWADCGGNDPNSLLDDTLQCYRKKLVASTPQGAVFSGIGVTDEKPDGDFSCGGVSDVPVKAVIMGAWSRLFPDDLRTQTAGGTGPQYCENSPSTSLGSICVVPPVFCPPGAAAGPTEWFPEGSYEPYKLNAGNPPPKKATCALVYAPAGHSTCCDGSTTCSTLKQTPCLMQNVEGWADAALQFGAPTPGVHNYVNVGIPASNADCQFANNELVTQAVQYLASKPNGKNVSLYARG
jgi:hypothetical protein